MTQDRKNLISYDLVDKLIKFKKAICIRRERDLLHFLLYTDLYEHFDLPRDLKLNLEQLTELENRVLHNPGTIFPRGRWIFRGLFYEYLHFTHLGGTGCKDFIAEAISSYINAVELNPAITCLHGLYIRYNLKDFPADLMRFIQMAEDNQGINAARIWMEEILFSDIRLGKIKDKDFKTEIEREEKAAIQGSRESCRKMIIFHDGTDNFDRYEKMAYYLRRWFEATSDKSIKPFEKVSGAIHGVLRKLEYDHRQHPALILQQIFCQAVFFHADQGLAARMLKRQMLEDNPRLFAAVMDRLPGKERYEEHVRPSLPNDLSTVYQTHDDLLRKQYHPAPLISPPVLPFRESKEALVSEFDEFKRRTSVYIEALSDNDLFPEYKNEGALSYVPMLNKEKYDSQKKAIIRQLSDIQKEVNADNFKSYQDSLFKVLEEFYNVISRDDSGYYNKAYLHHLDVLRGPTPTRRKLQCYTSTVLGAIQVMDEFLYSPAGICYIFANVHLRSFAIQNKDKIAEEKHKAAAKKWLLKAIEYNSLPAFILFKFRFPESAAEIDQHKMMITGPSDLFELGKAYDSTHNPAQAAFCYRRAWSISNHQEHYHLREELRLACIKLVHEHFYQPSVAYHMALTPYPSPRFEKHQLDYLMFYVPEQIEELILSDELIINDDNYELRNMAPFFCTDIRGNINVPSLMDPDLQEKYKDALVRRIFPRVFLMRDLVLQFCTNGGTINIVNIVLDYAINCIGFDLTKPADLKRPPNPAEHLSESITALIARHQQNEREKNKPTEPRAEASGQEFNSSMFF